MKNRVYEKSCLLNFESMLNYLLYQIHPDHLNY